MFKSLELKIPPPIIFTLCAIYVFLVRNIEPKFPLEFVQRAILGGVFIIIGLGLDFSGLRAFMKKSTTINPLAPNNTTNVVTDGIYKFTRNPMYLGLCLCLLGWCIINNSGFGFLSIPAFIKYIETFQIIPEENILKEKFGAPYLGYIERVRRWI